jgi:uncharacterized protein
MGPKAFEQSAGFLRIPGAANPLDGSAVHPEAYPLVEAMARDLGSSVTNLMADPALARKIRKEQYIGEAKGEFTIADILQELQKPGRDPRENAEEFSFDDTVHTMEDLKPGMRLPGIVTNITHFGAFVDIGVKQDGLVHVSMLSNRYVSDPAALLRLNQRVWVTVLEVDLMRKRISLSMKEVEGLSKGKRIEKEGAPRQQTGSPKRDVSSPKEKEDQSQSFEKKLADLKKKFKR